MRLTESQIERLDTDLDWRLFYIVDGYESGSINGIWYGPSTSVKVRSHETALEDLIEASGAVFIDPDRAIAAMGDEPLKDNFNYRALDKILGKPYSPQFQKRGTCVGQNNKVAADDTAAIASVATGTPFKGRHAVTGTYAGGRVESAGQPGTWDGSNSDWTLDFLERWGGLLLKHIGLPEDSLDPDEEMAVKYAADRRGLPENLEALAKGNKVIKAFTVVRTYEEVHRYLQSNLAVVHDSSIWATGRRDSQGFSQSSTQRGGHCQSYRACRVSGKPGILDQNSWGPNWANGPTYPDDQPVGSVWDSPEVVNARCKGNGTFVLFPTEQPKPVDLDWSQF